MTKQGWPSHLALRLPPEWDLREDVHNRFLYAGDDLIAVYTWHAAPETIEAEAWACFAAQPKRESVYE